MQFRLEMGSSTCVPDIDTHRIHKSDVNNVDKGDGVLIFEAMIRADAASIEDELGVRLGDPLAPPRLAGLAGLGQRVYRYCMWLVPVLGVLWIACVP